MSSPLNDATHAAAASPLNDLTPRQRAERVVAQLPIAGGVLAGAERQGEGPGADALVAPIQRINAVMRHYGVQFELQEYDARVVTRIVDQDSGDVIRQIPSEEVLRVAERIDALQGRLVDLEV